MIDVKEFTPQDIKREINYVSILYYCYIIVFTILAFICCVRDAYICTTLYSFILASVAGLGISAGAHRLWTHHTYQADRELKIFLMLCQTVTGQGSIYDWVLLHRIHHKYFDTDLDPFNPSRGFLYSFFSCALRKPSIAQAKIKKQIDMSDLENDSIVMFQKRYYWILFVTLLLITILLPIKYWNENLSNAVLVAGVLRHTINLVMASLINAATTIWSLKKGEKYPADTNMVFLIDKNYWLRYHYLTPWDYQTGEYGKYGIDCTSKFIRVCAALGIATNLKTVDSNMVQQAMYMAVDTKKPISECLVTAASNENLPDDHYLNPDEYINKLT